MSGMIWAHSGNQPSIYRQAWCDLAVALGLDPARIEAGARIFRTDTGLYELRCAEWLLDASGRPYLIDGTHDLARKLITLPVTHEQVATLEAAWKAAVAKETGSDKVTSPVAT